LVIVIVPKYNRKLIYLQVEALEKNRQSVIFDILSKFTYTAAAPALRTASFLPDSCESGRAKAKVSSKAQGYLHSIHQSFDKETQNDR
jgi:hypothetical protein